MKITGKADFIEPSYATTLPVVIGTDYAFSKCSDAAKRGSFCGTSA
jgi:hypothetical protein